MTFRPDPSLRYDMPVVFGPSSIPDTTTYGSIEIVTLSFVTTQNAVEDLVPYHLGIPDKPVVSISRMTYGNVDYMHGGGYSEITVGVSAIYDDNVAQIKTYYLPIVWVDNVTAMVIGREFLGYAKLMAELPPTTRTPVGVDFEMNESGSSLLRGSVRNMSELGPDRLKRVQASTRRTEMFGWKYIAGPQGVVDADYVTLIPLEFNLTRGWTGDANIDWLPPALEKHTENSRIVNVLATLPVVRQRDAFVGVGSGQLLRSEVQILRGVERSDNPDRHESRSTEASR